MAKSKNIVNLKERKFLEAYINNPAPTGFEIEGQKLWLSYMKPYIDEHFVDKYGTAVGVINPDAEYKVVIEAHADEISWQVDYITKDGYIYVKRNGGSDVLIAPSKRVNIHTKDGLVQAVFGWPAIHMRKDEKETQPTEKNIFLDCGCSSKEEVEELGIHVGCVITYEYEFTIINERYYCGRALDNRIGGFAISQVARLLKENRKKLPFGLYIVNAVQEEVGLRGAQMIANTIKPDVAIVTDVTHDTSIPNIHKYAHGDIRCGLGPAVDYAPAVHAGLRDFILETAKKHNIPFQRSSSSRSTGTDTDAFAYSNGGVYAALTSLPLRYMHTTVEMVDKSDLENLIRLIYETLTRIKNKQDFRLLK